MCECYYCSDCNKTVVFNRCRDVLYKNKGKTGIRCIPCSSERRKSHEEGPASSEKNECTETNACVIAFSLKTRRMSSNPPPLDYRYPKRDGNEYYELDKDGDVLFAERDGRPVYARDAEGNKIYPEKNGEQFCIRTEDDELINARDANVNQFYPKDKDENEKPIVYDEGYVEYAKDTKQNEFYPRNADRIERKYGRWAVINTNTEIYTLGENGRPVYEKDPLTGDEIYVLNEENDVFVIGKDVRGNQVYAKRQNGDEYYPEPDAYAKTKDDLPLYAFAADGRVDFPTDEEGNERYLKTEFDEDVVVSGADFLTRYTKEKNGIEIYPVREIPDWGVVKEVTIGSEHAKGSDGEPYYPCDECGNEFVFAFYTNGTFDEAKNLPIGYPITNDRWIVLCGVENEPYFATRGVPPIRESISWFDCFALILAFRTLSRTFDQLEKPEASRENTKFYRRDRRKK